MHVGWLTFCAAVSFLYQLWTLRIGTECTVGVRQSEAKYAYVSHDYATRDV